MRKARYLKNGNSEKIILSKVFLNLNKNKKKRASLALL
ncbi:hypothetical protein A33Q_2092 [Indibacter alkaliphilus LW1]|uniref:Uncharacterized protein n=1 Tax=Indibacter alkaliphilus (strain CCUG 57479 / KCTC 22604 / LW1) TaxID=1189612 RepID=S2DC58_INDAL|nr:hypothetical protein A33Q_2092 [Indibacter alkaliphilus LW1]